MKNLKLDSILKSKSIKSIVLGLALLSFQGIECSENQLKESAQIRQSVDKSKWNNYVKYGVIGLTVLGIGSLGYFYYDEITKSWNNYWNGEEKPLKQEVAIDPKIPLDKVEKQLEQGKKSVKESQGDSFPETHQIELVEDVMEYLKRKGY